MENSIDLFIIINGKKLQIFEKTSEETFEIYRIKGEDFLEIAEEELKEEFEELKKYILDNLYYDNFEHCNINNIYQDINKVTLNKIKPFFSTSNELTIYSLEELIALLLFKQGNIKPGERKKLSLEKDCFLVEIHEDGALKINDENKEPDIYLSLSDFLDHCDKLSLFSLKGNYLKQEIKKEIKCLQNQNDLSENNRELQNLKKENTELKETFTKIKQENKKQKKEFKEAFIKIEQENKKQKREIIKLKKIQLELEENLKKSESLNQIIGAQILEDGKKLIWGK